MYNPFSLKGKSILVTGASSGIGKEIALACAKMGAVIVLNGRDESRLNETASQMGGNHIILPKDLLAKQKYLLNATSFLFLDCPPLN